ncbi:hypothetical protein G7046_g1200 [Stylonectria norvegica]|nr:hypothetical protein G7046_g1200 [Stylonectria norvegica]
MSHLNNIPSRRDERDSEQSALHQTREWRVGSQRQLQQQLEGMITQLRTTGRTSGILRENVPQTSPNAYREFEPFTDAASSGLSNDHEPRREGHTAAAPPLPAYSGLLSPSLCTQSHLNNIDPGSLCQQAVCDDRLSPDIPDLTSRHIPLVDLTTLAGRPSSPITSGGLPAADRLRVPLQINLPVGGCSLVPTEQPSVFYCSPLPTAVMSSQPRQDLPISEASTYDDCMESSGDDFDDEYTFETPHIMRPLVSYDMSRLRGMYMTTLPFGRASRPRRAISDIAPALISPDILIERQQTVEHEIKPPEAPCERASMALHPCPNFDIPPSSQAVLRARTATQRLHQMVASVGSPIHVPTEENDHQNPLFAGLQPSLSIIDNREPVLRDSAHHQDLQITRASTHHVSQ